MKFFYDNYVTNSENNTHCSYLSSGSDEELLRTPRDSNQTIANLMVRVEGNKKGMYWSKPTEHK